jgi:hypothetical protein
MWGNSCGVVRIWVVNVGGGVVMMLGLGWDTSGLVWVMKIRRFSFSVLITLWYRFR